MSELDKYFSRLQNRPKPDIFRRSGCQPGCTNYPHVEERIRETLDEWTDCQGFLPRDRHTLKTWESGARDFVEAFGEKPKLLRKAWELYLDIEWEKRKQIIITTPRSLIGFARKVLEIEEYKRNEDYEDPDVRYRKAMSWVDDQAKDAWWHE